MNVLIADDNTLIRSWLKIMLQQAEQDIVILEACDGEEALRICLEQPVDLLITDIKMPGIDGVTLIRELTVQRPGIRSAVLSSYDDFSYVRVALKCGALDYILKAEMKQEDILGLLTKVKESLALLSVPQNTHKAAIQHAQTVYDGFAAAGDDEADTLLSAFGIPSDATSCSILMVRTGGQEIDSVKIAEIFCGCLKTEGLFGLAIPIGDRTYLILNQPLERSPEQARQIHLRLLTAMDQALTVANLGTMEENCEVLWLKGESLSDKLRQAEDIIQFQIYYGITALPAVERPGWRAAERNFLDSFRTLIQIGNSEQLCGSLQRYVAQRHEKRELPHRIRRVVITSVQMMLAALSTDTHNLPSHRTLEQLSQTLAVAPTAERMREQLERFCNAYRETVGPGEQTVSPAIARAAMYCNEHYSQRVTLEMLANLTGLNRSYFSQLFHKEMGKSFGDYLEAVRIQKACELLKADRFSMSEIAEQVGFSNQNYFTKVFKKVIGVPPSQYRQQANPYPPKK